MKPAFVICCKVVVPVIWESAQSLVALGKVILICSAATCGETYPIAEIPGGVALNSAGFSARG